MNFGGVEVGTLDLVFAVVLLVSAVVGLWRGLVFEVLSLLGWVVAYVAAQGFAPAVATMLPVGAPGSGLNHAAAFGLTFIAALIVWGLVARLVRSLLHASPLSPVDRLFGVAFGLLRGGVLLLVIATLVNLTPLRNGPIWQQSQVVHSLQSVLRGLKPWLPEDLARHLPT